MIKRSIGIDIGSSYLRAVQISRSGQGFFIEKVFSAQTRRSTDSTPDMLRSLITQHGFDRHAEVAISMPQDAVFFRNLETDPAGLEQITKLNPVTLEDNFPIQSDQAVAQICSCCQLPDGKYSVLTAAVTGKSLHERVNTLIEAKMHPALVDAAIFAVHSTVVTNYPEVMSSRAIIAYINEHRLTLAITQNNNILFVRNTPVVACSGNNTALVPQQLAQTLSDQAGMTWQKVFGRQIDKDTDIYLTGRDSTLDSLETLIGENLHCRLTRVNPCALVKPPPDYNGDTSICIAQGLALRVLAPHKTPGINFLEADNANIKPALNLRREFAILAALVAAIAVVSSIGLFIHLSLVEMKYADIKDDIRKVFQDTLPGEKNIVNPLAQLEQKLQSARKDYATLGIASGTAAGPVDILHATVKSLPSGENINLDDVLITTDSVRLTGTSQSFESVYNWQRLLQKAPQFSTVDVQDIRREPDSRLVEFTMSASLAARE